MDKKTRLRPAELAMCKLEIGRARRVHLSVAVPRTLILEYKLTEEEMRFYYLFLVEYFSPRTSSTRTTFYSKGKLRRYLSNRGREMNKGRPFITTNEVRLAALINCLMHKGLIKYDTHEHEVRVFPDLFETRAKLDRRTWNTKTLQPVWATRPENRLNCQFLARTGLETWEIAFEDVLAGLREFYFPEPVESNTSKEDKRYSAVIQEIRRQPREKVVAELKAAAEDLPEHYRFYSMLYRTEAKL